MEFQAVVRRRRMVRRYQDRPVRPRSSTGSCTTPSGPPSAGFAQGWGFLVLDTAEDVARFRASATPAESPERWFAANVEAPLVIVTLSNKDAYLDRYAQADKGHTDRSDAWWPAPYWDIDTGMAALLILQTAVDAGLGACFFGLPVERIGAFRQAFGVPDGFHPIGAISIGYPDEPPRDLSGRRRPVDQVVHRGRWTPPAGRPGA